MGPFLQKAPRQIAGVNTTRNASMMNRHLEHFHASFIPNFELNASTSSLPTFS